MRTGCDVIVDGDWEEQEMEALSDSECSHLLSISPLAEQGWEGMPENYNQRF